MRPSPTSAPKPMATAIQLRRARPGGSSKAKATSEEPWSDRHRHDQECKRLAVEPPQRPVEEKQPSSAHADKDEHAPADRRYRAVEHYDRRPVGQHKAALGIIEQPARRQIDLGGEKEERRGQGGDTEIDRELPHQRSRCANRLRASARSAAPASAVSSGTGYDQVSMRPENGRVTPAFCITSWKRASLALPPSRLRMCTGLPVAAASLIIETESAVTRSAS